ncbi:N-formylglutamate amidohydrolase [Crocinitomix algicola]|uniref:N-formylglutamate amidohydrolase n=1 Tax=Crocinitomix algicola TaxID=1740263 RepID=UPI000872A7B6|nr:N-formylglutamate amidohydrolase [Crocinitomix algicola]
MEEIKSPYYINQGLGKRVPLIISIPHVGTEFPTELRSQYLESQLEVLDDTDWFLDQLYSFAPEMGITVIKAKYHRWVIDLNRDPKSAPLYNDGRIITGLTSTTDFLGNPIYKDGCEPGMDEIDRRLEEYYWPYYQKIEELLSDYLKDIDNVILWDAHSIRESVPTIRKDKFPEMILGNADETSAHQELIQLALAELSKGYQVNHNDPFKGGHITRYFGNPLKGVHALQLERNKVLYMDDTEKKYHHERAEKMQEILKPTLKQLINKVLTL